MTAFNMTSLMRKLDVTVNGFMEVCRLAGSYHQRTPVHQIPYQHTHIIT